MMRTYEWINLIFFSFFTLVSLLRPITRRRRIEVIGIGVTGIILVLAGRFSDQFLSDYAASAVRDWLPAVLLPMVYWQAGRLSTKINQSFQATLKATDETLLGSWLPSLTRRPIYKWIAATFEAAYLSCYVLVPLGLGVLYLAHMKQHATEYWSVILPATYVCYAFTAFMPTLPPRSLTKDPVRPIGGNVRTLNLWFVHRVTTELNTFPSAHVTSTLGGSLLVFRLVPSVGWAFVLISIGIALGAVLGRYHYAADVLLGVVLAVGVYAVHVSFN